MGGKATSIAGVWLLAALIATMLAAANSAQAEVAYPGTTWLWGSPKPHGHFLGPVSMAGSRGYALGGEFDFPTQTLLTTADGGRTWSALDPPVQFAQKVEAFGPRTVLIQGCRSVVRSDNAGRQFTVQRLPHRECALEMDFTSQSSGYVAYGDGRLVSTDDAGSSFQSRPRIPLPETGGQVVTIAFPTRERGYAVVAEAGQPNAILRTTDGGRSWEKVGAFPGEVRDLETPNTSTVYLLGNQLLSSQDGGENFAARALTGSRTSDLTGITCASSSRCILVGSRARSERAWNLTSGALVLTRNGGRSARDIANTDGAEGVAFGSPGAAVAVGDHGTTLISDDAGSSFVRVGEGQDDYFYFGQLRRERGGLFADHISEGGERIGLSRSLDGGASWRHLRVPVPGSFALSDFSFATRRHGAAVLVKGSRAILLRTSDAGRTWRSSYRATSKRLFGVLMLSRRRVLIAGRAGLRISRDGGRRFRSVRTGGGGFVSEFDRGRGVIAVWGAGAATASGDGGRTWRRLSLPGSRRLWDLDLTSRRHGFAIVAPGRLYRTADGGRRWSRVRATRGRSLSDVSFSSQRNGYVNASRPNPRVVDPFVAMEGTGLILRTSDGGKHWRRAFFYPGYAVDRLLATDRGAIAQINGDLIYGPGVAPRIPDR